MPTAVSYVPHARDRAEQTTLRTMTRNVLDRTSWFWGLSPTTTEPADHPPPIFHAGHLLALLFAYAHLRRRGEPNDPIPARVVRWFLRRVSAFAVVPIVDGAAVSRLAETLAESADVESIMSSLNRLVRHYRHSTTVDPMLGAGMLWATRYLEDDDDATDPAAVLAALVVATLHRVDPSSDACPTCGEGIGSILDLQEPDNGGVVCGSCSYRCEHCEALGSVDDVRVVDAALFCDSCVQSCDHCSEDFAPDYVLTGVDSDTAVCSSCLEDFTYCEGCDAYYSEPCDRHSDDDDDDDDASARIHPYSYKPRPLFYSAASERRSPETAFFGVEIEASSTRESSRDGAARDVLESPDGGRWYLKEDCSIGHGFEMVSHPMTWAAWMGTDLGFLQTLRERGWRSYDAQSCGMHVHVSKRALSAGGWYKLFRMASVDRGFFARMSRRRSDALNRWATLHAYSSAECARKAKGAEDMPQRHVALNALPAHTVEFRLFRGTLDPDAARRNVAVCAALVAYARVSSLRACRAHPFVTWLGTPAAVAALGRKHADGLRRWLTPMLPLGQRIESPDDVEAPLATTGA